MVNMAECVSMGDVAKAAGVSKSAVSKALNNKPDISAEARSRILSVCEKLGYQVNYRIQDMVRERKSRVMRNIAFVLAGKKFADPAYAQAVDGIARGVRERDLHLLLETLRGDEASVYDLPPVLRDGRADGVVITGDLTQALVAIFKRLRIPCVILGDYSDEVSGDALRVELDFAAGLRLMVGKFKELGKRRIAYFTEFPDNFLEQKNLAVFRAAMTEHGLELPDALVYTGTGPFSGADRMMRPVFLLPELPFDAIVCLDHRCAQEIATLAMARRGLVRPAEIMVGSARPYAHFRLPVPAVFIQPLGDTMAYEGVNVLWDMIANGGHAVPRKIVLQSTIIAQEE